MNLEDKIACRGRVRRALLPTVRDPFINTRLLSLGPGADGRERFWISSCNMVGGSHAVLVDEDGVSRVFSLGVPHWILNAAVRGEGDTLWLCHRLNEVMRFTASTGRLERYSTGAPPARVGQGPVFDRATGKLFLAGYHDFQTVALSFDTRTKRAVKVHRGFAGSHTMRFSFPNGDGTWSLVMTLPGQSLLRWDPQRETLSSRHWSDRLELHAPLTARLVADTGGRWYVPELGWYNPRTGRFAAGGPRPRREMTWFARRGRTVFGAEDRDGAIAVHAWNLDSGDVKRLFEIPDAQIYSCELSRSGKIVAVNVYGSFFRFDARSGGLELCRPLPTDAVSHVDCLRRIDEDRLLGTTFITQRFWEVNLRTGRGMDCGRAAPGWGEVTQTWKMGDKIYMAAYASGTLVEYDPGRPARYPENPRVVARPPRGQRPVAATDDGRRLFYACTRPYPELGSVLIRYDTTTGRADYAEDPLPDQKITGLAYLRGDDALLAGTSMHADMNTGLPASDRCYLAILSAETLKVQCKVPAPRGTQAVCVAGPLGRRTWLCTCRFQGNVRKWAAVRTDSLRELTEADLSDLPEQAHSLQGAGRAGLFLLRWPDRLEVWDLRRRRRVRTLMRKLGGEASLCGVWVEKRSVLAVFPYEVVVLENALI